MTTVPSIEAVKGYFMTLQTTICETIEAIDGSAKFSVENIQTDRGGLSRPRVIDNGPHIERGAVQYTHSLGDALPPAASE